jgi:hypothetical protein
VPQGEVAVEHLFDDRIVPPPLTPACARTHVPGP